MKHLLMLANLIFKHIYRAWCINSTVLHVVIILTVSDANLYHVDLVIFSVIHDAQEIPVRCPSKLNNKLLESMPF